MFCHCRKSPESATIMLALAEIMLRSLPADKEKTDKLIEIIQNILKSIARQSSLPRGWFTLAQALIELEQFDWV
jgi:cytochrome c-type biogenesis protein CcmH/NrfG